MRSRFAVYWKSFACPCCAWETVAFFGSRKEAKRFVGDDDRLVIVKEEA